MVEADLNFPPPEDPEARLAEAGEFLRDWLASDEAPELEWRWQRSEDWAAEWKRGLEPRRVTARIVVKPTWTEWEPARGRW